ncbi:hypothetical protein N7471_000571 [Penicillium samsonianum]|uniref:uncharacterized protein n=1 Tax=Penicillium samsonianum TaxID=1882272 RepID=UPI002546FAB1|nr:uncharacterized protein N7471_000571 [Penicillium samsonianum]KAJ6149372.1 hypothetical protein N7471_000571 [Penicillium samsonianum]
MEQPKVVEQYGEHRDKGRRQGDQPLRENLGSQREVRVTEGIKAIQQVSTRDKTIQEPKSHTGRQTDTPGGGQCDKKTRC